MNASLQALASLNSGTDEPDTTYANMLWYDSGTNILKMRSENNDAWINVGSLDQSLNTFRPYFGVSTDLPAADLTGDIDKARVSSALNATGSAPFYAVRAWGNFNGDAITTRASGNLSIARTATGDFTFTMATALPDANYSVVITSSLVTGPIVANVSISSSSVFSCTLRRSSNEAAVNPTQIFVQVIR
jgi:hypothetical protein